ncbi:hypothetical protein Taro_037101, partial [Colocasia esculenta]|nr:hypothetical protein [Colocasia esculenta]
SFSLSLSTIFPEKHSADRDREMEEYLRNMKNLRAQMNGERHVSVDLWACFYDFPSSAMDFFGNGGIYEQKKKKGKWSGDVRARPLLKDVGSCGAEFEEEAASLSVEEQKQKIAVEATEKDLESARFETKRLNEEADKMSREKAQICCQILEKQKKTSSLAMESTTLSQTLELLQKETISLQKKLEEERMYYEKIREELNYKLQDQQDWVSSQKLKVMTDTVSGSDKNLMCFSEGRPISELPSIEGMTEDMWFPLTTNYKDLMDQLETARRKLEELKAKTSEISLHNNKLGQSECISELQVKIDGFPAELKVMDAKSLKEEHEALLADKAGELEYLQSLQERIEQLQGMSEEVKCQCGEEYKVELRD